MDRARAVHADVCDEPAFHQVDHIARAALLHYVRAHHEDHLAIARSGFAYAIGDRIQISVLERPIGRTQLQDVVQRDNVLSCPQWLEDQTAAVKFGVRHS